MEIGVGDGLTLASVLRDVVRTLTDKPSVADSKLLVEYVRRLDGRRVFYAPWNSEVVELVLGSLREVKNWTEEVSAKLDHQASRILVAFMLDKMRAFLDKWHAFRTPPWGFDEPGFRHPGMTATWPASTWTLARCGTR